MISLQLLYLIVIPLRNAGHSAVSNRMQRVPRLDEDAEPNTTVSKKKSSWKSTAYATARLLPHGVRDSADAFGPLKSVTGSPYFILENCEVWSFPTNACTALTCTLVHERERVNNQVVGTLGECTY